MLVQHPCRPWGVSARLHMSACGVCSTRACVRGARLGVLPAVLPSAAMACAAFVQAHAQALAGLLVCVRVSVDVCASAGCAAALPMRGVGRSHGSHLAAGTPGVRAFILAASLVPPAACSGCVAGSSSWQLAQPRAAAAAHAHSSSSMLAASAVLHARHSLGWQACAGHAAAMAALAVQLHISYDWRCPCTCVHLLLVELMPDGTWLGLVGGRGGQWMVHDHSCNVLRRRHTRPLPHLAAVIALSQRARGPSSVLLHNSSGQRTLGPRASGAHRSGAAACQSVPEAGTAACAHARARGGLRRALARLAHRGKPTSPAKRDRETIGRGARVRWMAPTWGRHLMQPTGHAVLLHQRAAGPSHTTASRTHAGVQPTVPFVTATQPDRPVKPHTSLACKLTPAGAMQGIHVCLPACTLSCNHGRTSVCSRAHVAITA
jgi:hypothetical protein